MYIWCPLVLNRWILTIEKIRLFMYPLLQKNLMCFFTNSFSSLFSDSALWWKRRLKVGRESVAISAHINSVQGPEHEHKWKGIIWWLLGISPMYLSMNFCAKFLWLIFMGISKKKNCGWFFQNHQYFFTKLSRIGPWVRTRTTDNHWRHTSKKSEKIGPMWQKNMLWPYLKIWEWEWIFGRVVKAISPLGFVLFVCFRDLRPWYISEPGNIFP